MVRCSASAGVFFGPPGAVDPEERNQQLRMGGAAGQAGKTLMRVMLPSIRPEMAVAPHWCETLDQTVVLVFLVVSIYGLMLVLFSKLQGGLHTPLQHTQNSTFSILFSIPCHPGCNRGC